MHHDAETKQDKFIDRSNTIFHTDYLNQIVRKWSKWLKVWFVEQKTYISMPSSYHLKPGLFISRHQVISFWGSERLKGEGDH